MTEKEKLIKEKIELEIWLLEHDYVGIISATEKTDIEEYVTNILERTVKSNRINEINELLVAYN